MIRKIRNNCILLSRGFYRRFLSSVFISGMYYFSASLLWRLIMEMANSCQASNVVCDGSPSRIRRVRRISLGMTTLLRSSLRHTIPVAFIYKSPFFLLFCRKMTKLPFRSISVLVSVNHGDLYCFFHTDRTFVNMNTWDNERQSNPERNELTQNECSAIIFP